MANAIDRKEYFVAPFMAPASSSNAIICSKYQLPRKLLHQPDEMHEIIDMLTTGNSDTPRK
jgi:hypothetical protein